ncbi:hypothetical protein [Photobacterium damselae]|uniref:hypothetical protein n=1 Tax=Photobacterium damselae TaxID=38293 RepID=UPI002F26D63C
MIDTAFIRTLFFQPILNGLEKRYQLAPQDWDIPSKLLQEPMSLTPFLDMTAWLESAINMTGDPNYLAKIADLVRFEQMGMLGEWFLSSPIWRWHFEELTMVHHVCNQVQPSMASNQPR